MVALRSLVRSLLPATNRNFEFEISCLRERVDCLQEKADVLLEQERRLELALRESIEVERRLEATFLAARDRSFGYAQYANAEYGTLGIASQVRRGGILIAGWYGASNCGDEIMLRTVLQRFEGCPLPVTVMLWNDYAYREDTLPSWVEVIHYPKSTWDIRLLASCYEVLVWGGGAILDDNQFDRDPDNVNTGNLFIRLSEMMIGRGKGVYAIGLSSNESFSSLEYCRRLAAVVEGCRYFSVRDPYSYAVLAEHGIDTSHVSLCEDLALANRDITVRPVRRRGGGCTVAFSPLCLDSLYAHNVHVLGLIHDALDSLGIEYEICLVPFCNERGVDDWYLGRMLNEFGHPAWARLGGYSSEIDDNEIIDSDLAICYRYHASLIALAYGVPLVACCYDGHAHYPNKMRHALELFEEEDGLMMYSSFDDDSFIRRIKSLVSDTAERKSCAELLGKSREWLDELCEGIVSYVMCDEDALRDPSKLGCRA